MKIKQILDNCLIGLSNLMGEKREKQTSKLGSGKVRNKLDPREASSFNRKARLDIGRKGEKIAREHLRKKGYRIIEQNYKTKYAEIDLVAKKKDELVFVEVRTRTGDNFGTPEETIDKKKLRKLRRNAAAYITRIKWKGSCRIDAVCIVLKKDYSAERLNHYENI